MCWKSSLTNSRPEHPLKDCSNLTAPLKGCTRNPHSHWVFDCFLEVWLEESWAPEGDRLQFARCSGRDRRRDQTAHSVPLINPSSPSSVLVHAPDLITWAESNFKYTLFFFNKEINHVKTDSIQINSKKLNSSFPTKEQRKRN